MLSKNTLRLAAAVLLLCFVACVRADADAEAKAASNPLGENRLASPGPLFDRIAALFSGSKPKRGIAPRPNPVYQQRPLAPQQKPPLPPPPPAPRPIPVRIPPQAPTRYNAAPSNNLPTYVAPGAFGGRPQPPPPSTPTAAGAPWQVGQPASMSQIKDLQVQCEKDMMRVRVIFDRPFNGMIFSKGHYKNRNCVHVPPGLGQTQTTFDIPLQACGMQAGGAQGYSQQTPQGSYMENTVIIQYDPLLQEVWDQARRLRCTWYDFYEKAVTFKPYQVEMLDPVTANFLGDNLRCWMQIQVGKGPQANEVSGIVKIGQTMTMVIGVKDDENKFDMMVRNCVAHDGTRAPIQLVDEKGCVSRPKIMSPFRKVTQFDSTANVLAYAYFQAFKFPDSMNVHFQCVVQVCRGSCPEPQCGGQGVRATANSNNYAKTDPTRQQQDSSRQSAQDSYGAPLGEVISNKAINPRLPVGGNTVYSVDADDQLYAPGAPPQRLSLSGAGQGDFNKRMGSAAPSVLEGKPRSLEMKGDEVNTMDEGIAVRNTLEPMEGDDSEVGSRKRRDTPRTDAAGNRILSVHRREATDMADVETTEKVIQVIAPNDVQFHLPTAASSTDGEDSDDDTSREVIINTNTSPAEAVCLDTTAFVASAVAFIMLLVIALITIAFMWMRIRLLTDSAEIKVKHMLH